MPPAPVRRGARRTSPRTNKAESENPESLDVDTVEVKIEELSRTNESVNWLWYGPSGVGKTTLVGGCPRATFLSTERGTIAAKRTGSTAKLIKAYSWEACVAGKKLADEKLNPGEWLILDSATKMQVLMIRWILRMQKQKKASRDLDIPAIKDHQKWQNNFRRFIDDLIDAPYNTIFVCGDMRAEDEEMETVVLPAITGKGYEICDYVRAQMDIVTYYGITDKTPDGEPIRRALFQSVPPYIAPKDRYSVFGKYQDVADNEFTAMAEFVQMLEEAA